MSENTTESFPTLAAFLKANSELQNHSSGVVLEPEPQLVKPAESPSTS